MVQFECDECISVVPRKLILDPPEPSVGDECRVEWTSEEYTAKVLAKGDDQQVRKAEAELLKGLALAKIVRVMTSPQRRNLAY